MPVFCLCLLEKLSLGENAWAVLSSELPLLQAGLCLILHRQGFYSLGVGGGWKLLPLKTLRNVEVVKMDMDSSPAAQSVLCTEIYVLFKKEQKNPHLSVPILPLNAFRTASDHAKYGNNTRNQGCQFYQVACLKENEVPDTVKSRTLPFYTLDAVQVPSSKRQ